MRTRATVRWVRVAFVLGLTLAVSPAVWGAEEGASPQREQARQILDATGIKGGLIVQFGCGDGKLTAALRASGSYLVHGLDSDAANVQSARKHIRSLGLYGKVSVEHWTGDRLPYIDNLVNLLISEDLGEVTMAEVMRVLVPKGVAYIKEGGKWTKSLKPQPEGVDQWTHYLHDATGNAVAHDSVVGPPRHLQWVGSPRWARHHDRMASLSALVSARSSTSPGRIFYIFDEGPTASILLPARRSLIARDALNGTILWKQPIQTWHTHLWPFKSGPTQLQRRLVAVGDKVYVTLGLEAPLSALDAATGQVVRTYQRSRSTEEVIASEGVLFLLVNEAPIKGNEYRPVHRNIGDAKKRVADEWPWDEQKRWVTALRADTGEILWRKEHRVVPLTMAADRERVFFHDGQKVVCLSRNSGEQLWNSSPVERRPSIPTNFGPTLVVYQDVVLFSGGTRSMAALSAETGETLWTAEHPPSGHNSPEDLLVVGGLVWAGEIAGGKHSGIFTGRDLRTGEIKNQFPPDVETYWFHHRCYRSKATDRYLLPSRTGIEFVDYQTKHWTTHHWVRGGCIYGIMPCNGLIYAPPHSCACYIEAKLSGFCALAPEKESRVESLGSRADDRLERGLAYDDSGSPASAPRSRLSTLDSPLSDQWPTYRHDPARSGFRKTPVPTDLECAWQTDLGGKLSSVVVAGNKLFVAQVDAHTVHALDAGSGETLWSYMVGGRVDSPPTIYQGRVLFGSADGWVYCLRAGDGKLIWRRCAAPQDRRLVSFEQLESVWPVHGSVLVQDDVVYCVAGRSMFLDGGMRLLRLDPKTGNKLSETILDERDPKTGDNLQAKVRGLNMPVALPDVLSSDGQHIFMRSQRFDLDGTRQEVGPGDVTQQEGEGVHLFCGTGFLDGSSWHRTYWVFGRSIASGAGGWPRAGRLVPAGRLLVFDESSVYGYGRRGEYYRWSTPLRYHLFATSKRPQIVRAGPKKPALNRAARQARKRQPNRKRRAAARDRAARIAYHWSREAPLHVRAMVLAAETLFVAGSPDVLDEEEAFDHPDDPEIRAKLRQQGASLEGQKGALLWAVSASDGEKLAEYELQSPPVFDGLAAAYQRLYLSTQDGKVLCFSRPVGPR